MKKSAINIPEGCTRVLLHACCAPCSSAIVEWLLAHEIEPVIYYYNPNIYPREEYEIRKNESKRHAESLGVKWIDGDYDHDGWRCAVKGLEKEPERGKRCEMCFYHRLLATARRAQEAGIPFFATTLASSRWKNIDQVNTAGERAAVMANGERRMADVSVRFWAQNWRKDGLQDRRNALLKEYGFYNQLYCGCEFSARPAISQ
ncbi:MAG: epoxyqueuosine reductase QueH [Paludibacteraceae bacterium]|nr:epoxyqueuosine reductase QueH [Paludibacteraceae bacterium]